MESLAGTAGLIVSVSQCRPRRCHPRRPDGIGPGAAHTPWPRPPPPGDFDHLGPHRLGTRIAGPPRSASTTLSGTLVASTGEPSVVEHSARGATSGDPHPSAHELPRAYASSATADAQHGRADPRRSAGAWHWPAVGSRFVHDRGRRRGSTPGHGSGGDRRRNLVAQCLQVNSKTTSSSIQAEGRKLDSHFRAQHTLPRTGCHPPAVHEGPGC
jgi:hypothetical protein